MFGLAACAGPGLDDGQGYIDRITPDPAALARKAEENRLAQAERLPVTVRPPSYATPPNTATTQTVDPVAPVDPVAVDSTVGTPAKPEITPEGDGAISNSQDFEAAKAKDSIQSDAQKLKDLKDNYEIVQPGKTPTRGTGINLAEYALSQTNPVGNKIYSRFSLSASKAKRKCASYISADEAQIAFLNSGGPKKDRRGIDPDGDGYACAWSPNIYRALIGQ